MSGKEYVEELYNIGKECNTAEDQGPDWLTEKILLALKEMNNNKAEGPDNIPVEMLKYKHIHKGDLASRLLAVDNVIAGEETQCKKV